MLLILISVSVTTLFVWDYLFKRRRNRLINSSRILGPKHTLPLIGDALNFLGNDSKNIFSKLENLSLVFGKVYRLWVGHRLILFVKDPKYFQVILPGLDVINKKPFFYEMIACLLGNGLLLSVGSKWRARRKIITPTYHFKILDDFIEVFAQQNEIFVKDLFEHADGKTVIDIFPKVCLMALDIIAETAMGVKINAQADPDFPYTNALTNAESIIATRVITPVQYYELGFILTAFPSYIKLNKSLKIMHSFTNKVINDRRTALKSNNEFPNSINNTSDDIGQKKRMAFLDVLLQARIDGKPLTNEEIQEEVDTFMVGGHDTTSSAISYCLYLLSRHAAIQQKVFEEIVEIIGDDKDKPVTMRDLLDLKYLELVIKESLRLYPSLPLIGRHTKNDIQVDDQIIPGNTHMIFLLYAAGRDPEYFDNPNDFIPERHYSDQQDNKTASFANIPFSVGPRNCIGQKFAMLEMKSTISKTLRHFELLPLGPDVVPDLNIILRSSTGMNLGLKIRNYK